MHKILIHKIIIGLILSISITNGSFAQAPLVFDVENRTVSGCVTAPGNTSTSLSSLPDPFSFTNGGGVSTFDDWTCRRNQIKSDIEHFEIGPKPPKPSSVTATYSGGKLTVVCTNNGQTLTLTSNVTIPSGSGPFPIVIGMNAPSGQLSANLFSGVIQIPFNHDQVVSYGAGSGSMNAGDPYFKLYPGTNIGKYSAWSWGISRLIDGIELVKAQMNADLERIAVTGCSYAGKMALFGGAFDERIALTIAQESGGGGINSWRMSQQYTTRTGVNVEKIDNTNYSWFKSSLKNVNPNSLPYDHHELIAMIAPRALLILGNPTQEWLCDESGYKSTMAAAEVWKAMGVSDRLGFVFAPDHNHCSASTGQNTAVTAFVNKFLKNNTSTNTAIRTNPTKGTQQNLTINSSVFNWTTPTITFTPKNPNTPQVTITAPTNGVSIEQGETVTIKTTVTDADNNVTKVELFAGTYKIGEDNTAPYTFNWSPLVAGKYALTAVATDASSNTGTSTVVLINVTAPPYEIIKTPLAPTIDGIADEIWNNSSVLEIEATNVIVGTVSNKEDLSGKAKFLWDNTNLYVFTTIIDNVKVNDSPNAYDDDAVEIYLDINNDKASTYGANDVQYTFGWNDGTTVGSLPSGRSTVGISYTALSTTNGYIIEAKIPWSTVLGSPAINQFIGLDFMINDDDNGDGRDKKLAWSATTDDAWQNPSLFGVAKLVGEPIITGSTTTFSTSSLSYFPNPFTDDLTIRVNENSSYQLIGIDGRVVEEGIVEKEANIGKNLQKGSYLLRLHINGEFKTRIVLKN